MVRQGQSEHVCWAPDVWPALDQENTWARAIDLLSGEAAEDTLLVMHPVRRSIYLIFYGVFAFRCKADRVADCL
ncbi:hypothetical protein G6F68_020538 [Rhizopus microsporus]|nr:hypothetical protein G6F68_020538 [Rhizopus microsporus]